MSEALGRVVATERKPNTPHEFHFWTAIDSPVGIGTIVRVDGANPMDGQIPHIYGIVVEGFSYTDLQTPMHDVLGHDGLPTTAGYAATERAEIRLYTAAVLRQIPEEPLQPVPMGQVFLAEEADVQVALRMDSYLREGANTGIPIGVYRAGGTEAEGRRLRQRRSRWRKRPWPSPRATKRRKPRPRSWRFSSSARPMLSGSCTISDSTAIVPLCWIACKKTVSENARR